MLGSLPLVAVVTPVLNGAKFLDEAMVAVQAQTYPNLVHVVLDNASTDGTPELIDRYRASHVPLIAARNAKTLSQAKNFNAALAMMPQEVEYFIFLCADDLIAPRAVELMVNLLQQNPDMRFVAPAEMEGSVFHGRMWPAGDVFNARERAEAYFLNRCPISPYFCMFRRVDYHLRQPYFYDEGLAVPDVDAMLALMDHGTVGYIRTPIVFNRIHDARVTSTILEVFRMDYADWVIFLQRYAISAMGEGPGRSFARRYKRYYFRRLLRWRFVDKRADLVKRHMAELAYADEQPGMGDYLDAIVDWFAIRVGLRPPWENLYPA